MIPFREFTSSSRLILLDGATGTELARRGVDLSGPSWTAAAIRQHPDVLYSVHRDYVDAGAEIVTANTFRTHARNLENLELAGNAEVLVKEAVQIARAAAGGKAYVAGSIAPLGDCYSPDQTPPSENLLAEHRRHVTNLQKAGVDLLLIETQITTAEAVAATQAAVESGLPVIVSFYCPRSGQLLSGEPLCEAVQQVRAWTPLGISINCVPAEDVMPLLSQLSTSISSPNLIGVYANTGRALPDGTWIDTPAVDPANYAELARAWVRHGVRLVGGCCGTTPDHISLLKNMSYDSH